MKDPWRPQFFWFEHDSWWEGLQRPMVSGTYCRHFPNIPTLNTSCTPFRLCQASYHMAYIPGVWTLEKSYNFAGLGKPEAAGHWSPLAETHVRDSWWYCTLATFGNFLMESDWLFCWGYDFGCVFGTWNFCRHWKGRCLGLQPFSTFELLWMGLWAGDHCLGPWFAALLVTRPAAKLAKSRFNPAESALLASTAVDRSVGLYAKAWDVMLENSIK